LTKSGVDGQTEPFRHVRLYAHCARTDSPGRDIEAGAVVVYGMNLRGAGVTLAVGGLGVTGAREIGRDMGRTVTVQHYILEPHHKLWSKVVRLNGHPVHMHGDEVPFLKPLEKKMRLSDLRLTLPKTSLTFFVLNGLRAPACL
jgi:hypothetical protein